MLDSGLQTLYKCAIIFREAHS